MDKAHEILKGIRTLAPDWFKVPYLIPMTDTIERCRQYAPFPPIRGQKIRHIIAFRIIDLTDQLQQIELHAGLFIAVKDGKVLDEPIHIGGGIAEQAEADAWKVYNKAHQEVIFDGWERFNSDSDRLYVRNIKQNVGIEFIEGQEEYKFFDLSVPACSLTISNIESLAGVTSHEPLEFK